MRDMWQMSPEEQKERLIQNWAIVAREDQAFHYDGKISGIDPQYIPYFEVVCGELRIRYL